VHSRQSRSRSRSRSRSGDRDTEATHNQNEHNEYSVTSGSDSSEQGEEMYNKTEIVTNENNIERRKPGQKRRKKKKRQGTLIQQSINFETSRRTPAGIHNGNGTTRLPVMYSTGSTMAQHMSTTHCPQQEGECLSAAKCTEILSHQTPVMLRRRQTHGEGPS
jgi:hypothetical protein